MTAGIRAAGSCRLILSDAKRRWISLTLFAALI